jgi:hypothetical protein
MSRRRGEITGLMNELPRLVAHNYRPADRRFFLPILIFFVLEARVSPEGANDAIGVPPRFLLDAMRSAKRAIEVPLNTTYRLTIFIPFIRA